MWGAAKLGTRVAVNEKARLCQLFEEGNARRAWWDEHWDELVARYPDQFVAVVGREVVGARADLSDLLDELDELYPGERPVAEIEFVTADQGSLVL
jgi:hypothetical protein